MDTKIFNNVRLPITYGSNEFTISEACISKNSYETSHSLVPSPALSVASIPLLRSFVCLILFLQTKSTKPKFKLRKLISNNETRAANDGELT